MADSSSAVSSTVLRYRPAILIFTGLAAAYGVWFLQAHFSSSSEPPTSSLRRRGAVHERRSRRDGNVNWARLSGSSHAAAARDESSRGGVTGRSGSLGDAYFGTHITEGSRGEDVELRLTASSLLSVEGLQVYYGFSEERAMVVREELENEYLDRAFLRYLPRALIYQDGQDDELPRILRETFTRFGLSETNINSAIARHNHSVEDGATQTNQGTGIGSTRTVDALDDGRETNNGAESEFSWRGDESGANSKEGQNLLNLLYHIAEDQARREGYVHRGVTCNSCGNMPIRGIRYRCANCIDYDLCETCEAMQIHHKTHLFYKVRIPAPFLGNPRQAQPVWYPGRPGTLPTNMTGELSDRLMRETNFEISEIEALWDQYKCLAATDWLEDPNSIGVAIDRRTFDKCFVPNTAIRPPPPNLIYDRMFAFYDTNCDGLIGFEEFIKGLASLNNKTKDERLRRIFQGYDIDNDGFVSRRDFLRMFRAFYALSKELTKDMVAAFDDDSPESGTTARDVVLGSQPISAAFQWHTMPRGEPSRSEGKRRAPNGDDEVIDGGGVVRENGDDRGDHNQVIADAAERSAMGDLRPSEPRRFWESMLSSESSANVRLVETVGEAIGAAEGNSDTAETDSEDENDSSEENEEDEAGSNLSDIAGLQHLNMEEYWPPRIISIEAEDVETALGSYINIADIESFEDRVKVVRVALRRLNKEDQRKRAAVRAQGVQNRWRRRQFYLDEENGMVIPEAFSDGEESPSEDAEKVAQSTAQPSPRSRSSSKVRFEDDVMDPDDDMRSNPSTSSRSIPVGERWGGIEIPEAEKDVGNEILYQVTQQGLNEMLDPLFQPREDLALEALLTRGERKKWRAEIDQVRKQSLKVKFKQDSSLSADDADEPVPNSQDSEGNIVRSGSSDGGQDPGEKDTEVDKKSNKESESDDDSGGIPVISRERGVNETNINTEECPPLIGGIHSSSVTVSDASSTESTPHHNAHEDLLETSGDTVAGTAELSASASSSDIYESPHDPTLPQNRPNSLDEPHPEPTSPQDRPDSSPSSPSKATPATPSAATRPTSTAATSTREAPTPSAPMKEPTTAAERLALLSASPAFKEAVPPRSRLEKLMEHDATEEEDKRRGGAGRLNFAEFEEMMKGEKGRRLGFVGGWIEMASF